MEEEKHRQTHENLGKTNKITPMDFVHGREKWEGRSRAPPYNPLGPEGPRPHEWVHRTFDTTEPGQLQEFNPMDFVHGREKWEGRSRAPPYNPLGPEGPRPHEWVHRTFDTTEPGQLPSFLHRKDGVGRIPNGKQEKLGNE